MKDQSSCSSELPSSLSGEDDVLWEYDGLHEAYQGECEEILLEMQRIFYEDIKMELCEKGELHSFCVLMFIKGCDISLFRTCLGA